MAVASALTPECGCIDCMGSGDLTPLLVLKLDRLCDVSSLDRRGCMTGKAFSKASDATEIRFHMFFICLRLMPVPPNLA